MNYSELLVETLEYTEGTNDAGDSILQFRILLVGTGVQASSGLNLTQIDTLLANWDSRDLTWDNAMEVGHILGNALFPEPIRPVLLQHLPKPGSEDNGLRIRLFLQYPLTNYPFEYLLINDTGGEATANHFLALHRNLSIVRHQNNQAPRAALPPAIVPSKMVVALASPAAFAPVLDLSKERAAIQEAVNKYPERIQAVFCEPATLTNLGEALKDAPIFHYAGHASMPQKASKVFGLLEGKGKLILDDDDGDGLPDPINTEQLSVLLKAADTRLAVLGGCETARRDDRNVWSSLAAHLLNAGLFAVIGMQYKIGNKSATAFSSAFYNALLAGLTIDQAVTNGRMAVAALDNPRDWAVPVLYLSGWSDGIVFKEFKDDPALESKRKEINIKIGQVVKEVTGKLTGIKARNISWGNLDVSLKVDRVEKGAVVKGVEAGQAGPGTNITVKEEFGTVAGEAYGIVIDEIGTETPSPPPMPPQPKSALQVEQDVGTVQDHAGVAGAIVGSEGPVHVGGTQHYNDVVRGDKTEVNTGGGVHIGGNVNTGGGDFVGRDQIVHGDAVGGDRITIGDISGEGVAIGRGASATVNKGIGDHAKIDQVVIYQGNYQPGTGTTKRKDKLIEEKIRLDAALPATAQLEEPFDLAVSIRQPDAPALAIEDLEKVASADGSIFRARADEIVQYRVVVTGPGCLVEPNQYVFRLRTGQNSSPFYFQVTPQRPGRRTLIITAYQEDDALAAQTRVALEVHVPVVPGDRAQAIGPVNTDLLYCTQCGTANRPGDKFCKECGKRLPVN